MGWLQLKLPLDEPVIADCPRCGLHFDARESIRDRIEQVEAVLCHPLIRVLPEPTRLFLRSCPSPFLLGERDLGVMRLHIDTGLSPAGVHYQLQKLITWQFVRKVQKVPDGSTRKYHPATRYHLYHFFLPAFENSEKTLKNY